MSICGAHCTQETSPYTHGGSPTNPPACPLKSAEVSPSLREGKGGNAEQAQMAPPPPHALADPAIDRSAEPNITASLNERVVNRRSDAIVGTKVDPAHPASAGGEKVEGSSPPAPSTERGFISYNDISLRPGIERVFFPDSVYTGTLDVDGNLSGIGKAEWKCGDTYEGEWLCGRMHGSGMYTWADGDYYEGQYVHGYMCGFGEMKDAGSVYKGDWVEDMREGMGRMVYANNDVYEGEWLGGMRHGRGKLVESNGNVYEGEFVRNEKEGKGILTKKNGDVYEGDFMMGMFNGSGMYMWADGVKYIGYFKNGLRHGEGREWHPDGKWIFANFINGNISQQYEAFQDSDAEDFEKPEPPDNLEIALEPLNPKQLRQLVSAGTKKTDRNFGIDSNNDFNKTAPNNVNPDSNTKAIISISDEQNAVQDKVQRQNTKAEEDTIVYRNTEEIKKEVGVKDLKQEHTSRESRPHSPLVFPQDISLPVFAPCSSVSNSDHMNLGVSITSMSFGLPLRQRPLSDKNLQDWRQVKIIGKGSFGSVYEALLTCGRTVCCKVVHLGNAATREDLLKLKNEISLMKRLYHTNIVQYYGCLKNKSDNTLNIFMEFVSGGSLSSFVKKFKKIPYETMRQWTYQMVCGVRYLHSCGIVHRDIKGDNVLVSLEGIVKLADFGCSKHIDVYNSKDGCATMVGTPYWMAPEVIKCDARGYGTKSDIWSIGCTIVEMLTGRPPWPECNSVWAAVYKIANSTGLPTEIPRDIDPKLMDLLEKCFERDPQKRPSAEELLDHPFLSEVAKDSGHSSNESK
ncbi:unnamed protein product [Phytomonas sp. EM1]|nr:unnamed protein product [Phytomonas sp. EM1]|eukprot:CCW65823.1 unnamed protein product [Phytomonas sp. isolate EM1]